jgi:hypothetical protein
MMGLPDFYLQGLKYLREEVKNHGEDYKLIDMLYIRLKENIETRNRQGDAGTTAARMEILETANDISNKLFNVSFIDYCQSHDHLTLPPIVIEQEMVSVVEKDVISDSKQAREASISTSQPEKMQQAIDFLATVNHYVATLRENVLKAKGIFPDDKNTNIDRRQCRSVLSSFFVFECDDFPVYNQSLYRARARMLNLKDEVNKLTGLCGVCNDIDRYGKLNAKKVQELVGMLDSLYYEVLSIQKLLGNIDFSISN